MESEAPHGSVAQSVEQRPFKALVPGSSPGRPTLQKFVSGQMLMSHIDCHSFAGDALFGGGRCERFLVWRTESGACRRVSAGCALSSSERR